jgi:hypothetical protein
MMRPHHSKTLLSLLLLFACLSLTSCMRTYQRCYEHAFATDGVYCAPDAVYHSNGKKYARGQRARLRNVRYRSWENFYEWYYHKGWEMHPISGTEGETVYHELKEDAKGRLTFADNAEWISTPAGNLTPLQNKTLHQNVYISDATADRHLTWRGLYALPASAACFAVEAPLNVTSVTLFLLRGIIGAMF